MTRLVYFFGMMVFLLGTNVHAEMDMQCYTNCIRSWNGAALAPTICQRQCGGQTSEFDMEYKPWGGLKGVNDGIRESQEQEIRDQQARQIELQNQLLQQQLEMQKRQSSPQYDNSRQAPRSAPPREIGRTDNSTYTGKNCKHNGECQDNEFCGGGSCLRKRELYSYCRFDYQCEDSLECTQEKCSRPSASRTPYASPTQSAISPQPSSSNPQSDYIQGKKLWLGEGVTQNRKEAIRYFERSADAGFLPSIEMMVLAKWDGLDTLKDQTKAVAYAQKGAELGGTNSMHGLGLANLLGIGGITKNPVAAFDWFHKAAQMENKKSKGVLGLLYVNGIGVAQDFRLGIKWLTGGEVDEKGTREFLLGRAYLELGVQAKSLAQINEGLEWNRKAEKLGHPQATKVLAAADKLRTGAK